MASRALPFSRPVSSAIVQAGRLGEWRDGLEMLTGEHFRRRHQRGLSAGFNGDGHRQQRDDCFARADVALQQAQHAVVGGKIGCDFLEGS